jgi:hypothetical protein
VHHRVHALLRSYLRLIVVDVSMVLQQKTTLDAICDMLCDSGYGHLLVPV